jgi:hypothetical protein
MKQTLKSIITTAAVIATVTFVLGLTGAIITNLPYQVTAVLRRDAIVLICVALIVCIIASYILRYIEDGEFGDDDE